MPGKKISLKIKSRENIPAKLRMGYSGFTLIELLVVISIIGVLSSLILVSVTGARGKAQVARAQADINGLYKALLLYNANTTSWPSSDNIDTLILWNGAWKTGYINGTIPADPWGTAYFFDGPPNIECGPGQSSLCSAGPNKAFGSQNRADMTTQGDDICIYFEPKC